MDTETFDVAVIGGGPMGIELAVALKGAGVNYVHLEAGQIGATMQWWAPGTRWFSSPERIAIAGVPLVTAAQEKATREEYLAYLRAVVMQFELEIRVYEKVVGVERGGSRQEAIGSSGGGGFLVRTRRGEGERGYLVRRVIFATGGTARANLLGIAGERLGHVSHYFQDPHTYFGQRVLVVGGRNSAAEAALRCHRAGAKVSVSYRHERFDAKDIKYWLLPELEGLLKAGAIGAYFNTVPVEITATRVRLQGTQTGPMEVPADFVLLMTGYEADMSLLEGAGVRLDGPQRMPVFDEHTMETNVAGLYVAGTAIAGTQSRYKVFLENCHVHAERIVRALSGRGMGEAEEKKVDYAQPES